MDLSKFSIGDKIKVTYKGNTKKIVKEGFFIPRPSYFDDDSFVFKMDSGYNFGIKKADLLSVDLIEKKKEVKKSSKALKSQIEFKKKISILSLGGTISSRVDYKTGGVSADLKKEDLFNLLPSLRKYNVSVRIVDNKMSENITDSDFVNAAKAIKEEVEKGAEGILLLHGTDTLHYSSAMLSYMLENLSVPVILTGSQRSLDRGSSDAFLNIEYSCKALNFIDFGKVMVGFHETDSDDSLILLNGTRTRKMHSTSRGTFKPINDLPIARIFEDGFEIIDSKKYYEKENFICSYESENIKNSTFEINTDISDKIYLLYYFPGLNPDILDKIYELGYRVVIFMGTGMGHVNVDTFLPKIIEMKGKLDFFMTSQTINGRVNEFVYSNLRLLSKHVTFLEDMISEVAFCKAKCFYNKKDYKSLMKKNICDDISF